MKGKNFKTIFVMVSTKNQTNQSNERCEGNKSDFYMCSTLQNEGMEAVERNV